jgi:hypothetical protein
VEDSQAILTRFNRLIRDIESGGITRTCFRAWEVELLADMAGCDLRSPNRRQVLRRYAKAVRRQLERGSGRPLKLSEYLARNRPRAESVAGAA